MTVLGRLARASLPATEGTLRLPCLEAPVEVVRDRHGIVHVAAGSRADLVRAQGFVHAQDRLWQMEVLRRFAWGRLAEVFGRRALRLDRVARRFRLRWAAERHAAACDPETAALLEAYCEGVNAFLAAGPLPLELRLARVRPAPWTIVDAHAPGAVLTLALSGNWESELARMRLLARVGAERARLLEPAHPDDLPVIVPPRVAARAQRRARLLRRLLGSGVSNCWAVAGTRTASGKPLLANDPHLLLAIPGIWHAQHLAWDGGNAAGVTVPGVPVLILGRNEHVAWGMTTAMVDTQDLYVERLDAEDRRRYAVDGGWAEAEVVREEIRVRGRREPEVEEVVVTRHGPLVVDPEPGSEEALALRWSGHEPGESARSLFDLMVAGSVEEADAALDRFAGPPHNFLLADGDGTVAYRLAGGPIPCRAQGDGLVPAPGRDAGHEWDGWIPQEELPRVRDPERGFIATANNRIVGDDYRYPLSGEYLSGYRAQRIEALLAGFDAVTVEDCRRMQLDLLSLPGLALAEALRGLSSDDPLEREALELLASWDGWLGPESRAGAVYAALMRALQDEVFAAIAGAPEAVPPPLAERTRPLVLQLLAARDESRFADGRRWPDVFAGALTRAVAELGPDPAAWRWGDRHRVRFQHALDAIPLLGRLLARGPYAAGGDADTVSLVAAPAGTAGACLGASLRAVYDLADADGTWLVVVPGQSGHVASPNYDDMIPGWRAGELVRVPLTPAGVEEVAERRLRLEPGAGE